MIKSVVFIFNLYQWTSIVGFNINTNNVKFFSGSLGSQSGYSVTTWFNKRFDRYDVVFGAPGHRVRLEDETYDVGGVFHCSWDGKQDCQLITSLEKILTSESQKAMKLVNESEFTCGLGETLSVSSGEEYLMACAPRYLYRTRYQNLDRTYRYDLTSRGKCFVLEDFDKSFQSVSPLEDDYYKRGNYIYAIRHGQAGLSVSSTKDGQFITGSPSQYHNRGVTQSCNLKDLPRVACTGSHIGTDYSFNELIYEGFAITTGKFDGKSEIVASSAPGLTDTNKIIFYRPKYLIKKYPRRNLVMSDFEVRSFYGYALAADDFDADGADDLVVSAPWSNVRTSSIYASKNVMIDAGKVYVYYSPLKQFSRNPDTIVLEGHAYRGNFGHSLFCPGDLNMDSYKDLVVGAPYEGTGTIYIYNGSPTGLRLEPSQVITALEISSPSHIPAGFGFSLGGGHDVDGSSTPDLVVGAIKNSRVVLLRSAPVVNLVGEISLNASGHLFLGREKCVLNYDGKRTQTSCFELSLSLQYNGPSNYENIPLDVHVSLDTNQPSSRLIFSGKISSMGLRFSARSVSQEKKPHTFKIYVKPGKHDLKDPVHASMKIALPPNHILQESLGLSSEDHILPVLNAFGSTEFNAVARLICGDSVGCFPKPDLILSGENSVSVEIGNEPLLLRIDLVSLEADGYQIELKIAIPSPFSLNKAVTSTGESLQCRGSVRTVQRPRHNLIQCSLLSKLYRDKNVTVLFEFSYDALAIVTSLTTRFEVEFEVNSDNEDFAPKNNYFNVTVNPRINSKLHISSFAIPETSVIWTNYSQKYERKFFGAFDSDDSILFEDPSFLGPSFTHTYRIVNRGPSPITYAELRFRIPVTASSTPYPLVLLELPGPSFSGDCEPVDERYLIASYTEEARNNTGFNDTASGENIIAENTFSPQALTDRSNSTLNKNLHFTCSPSSNHLKIKCLEIKCSLTRIKKDEEFDFSIRGFMMALTAKKLELERYKLTSVITMEVRGTLVQKMTTTSLETSRPQTIRGYLLENIWILALTVLVGVLVIALLALLLYKIGFFKRAKKEQLLSEKREYRKSILLRKDSATQDDPPHPQSVFVI